MDICPFCSEPFRGKTIDFIILGATFDRKDCGTCEAVWIRQGDRPIFLRLSPFDERPRMRRISHREVIVGRR